MVFACFCNLLYSQTTITTETGTTGYTYTNGVAGNSLITFVIENTNTFPVNLDAINIAKGTSLASPAIFKLWYSSTSLAGAITLPTANNADWTLITTSASLNLVSGYANTIFNNLTFQIPSNTQYRFAIESNNGMSYSGTGAGSCTPNTFTQDGIIWKIGEAKISTNNVGYGGVTPSPTNNPRWFTGSITLSPATPCTAPPSGGAAISNVSTICAFTPFNLSLSSAASQGTGLTYQWDSSSNGTTWFPIAGATTRSIIKTQVSSSFYRCNLTCSGNTVQSTSVQVTSPLLIPSSSFTINKTLPTGGTNFNSFAEAINYIRCGISGPVTFTVNSGSGPYNEQVEIPAIPGVSSTNKITIKGNNETLNFTPTVTTSRHVLWLNGADHITIDSLNVTVGGTVAGWGIVLTNQSDSNIISNCRVDVGNPTSTSTNFIPIVINGSNNSTASSGNNGNYNIIEKNTLLNGSNGFYLYGSTTSTTQNVGNIFRNNIVKEFYGYGVSAFYASEGTLISKNDFSRPSRTNSTTTGGVSLSTGCRGVLVEKNRVHNLFDAFLTSTSAAYGVFVSADAVVGFENKVINNAFYAYNGNGIHYGVGNSGGDHMQAFHNTIVMDDAAATGAAYGLHQTTVATGVVFKNNIVSITKGGTAAKRAIAFVTTTSTIVSNKNILYLNATAGTDNHIGQFGAASATFNTISNWQSANAAAYDQGSLSVNPNFVDPTNADFTPQEASINGIGDNVGVLNDIRDTSRTATPDPGAFEFALAGCTNPITAGTAVSSATDPCANSSFTLNLTGNTSGAGIKYQWIKSANSAGPWVNVGTLSDVALFSTTQTDTSFYRCIARCNLGTPDTSSTIKVNTTDLISGSFTINATLPSGSGNFNSFADAINHIRCGINGPVTFTVSPGSGPYIEQVEFPTIPGASATNKITIKGNNETLTFTPTVATSRHVLWLNGADHVTIDSLNITVGGTIAGWGVVLTNQADSNRIRNCTIDVSNPTSTSSNFIPIVINGANNTTAVSGNNGNGNIIEKNILLNGFYSFYFYGNSTSTTQNINNQFKGNIAKDFYSYGILVVYASEGTLISKNDFSRPTRTNSTGTGAINISTGSRGVLFEKNRVHNLFDAFLTSTSIAYGALVSADAEVGKENKIINNAFYNFNGNGTHYGISNSSADHMQAYHNTIVMNDAAATGIAYGLHQTTAAVGIDFRNNIVSISKGGTAAKRCAYFVTTTSTITANNNVYHLGSSSGTDNNIGQFGTTNYIDLAAWKTANTNAYDQASISIDPLFVDPNNGDLTFGESNIDGIGANVNVLNDIVDSVRSITPDPGCLEKSFLVSGVDIATTALVSPAIHSNGCYTNAETLTIRIKNLSTSAIDFSTKPCTITVKISGAASQTVNHTINTGTLASNTSMEVTLPSTIDLSTVGVYSINPKAVVIGDVNTLNDSIANVPSREKIALNAGTVSVTPSTFCAVGGIQPTLNTVSPTGHNSLKWQSSNTSNASFTDILNATTNPFTTSSPLAQTTYFRAVAICGTQTHQSVEDTVEFSNPQILTTTPRYTCGTGTVTLSATATPGATINWYAAASGGASLGNGLNFTTPSISSTTTYYAAASLGGTTGTVGPLAPTSLGTISASAFAIGTYYQSFDVLVPTVLNTIDIYPTASVGTAAAIEIRNSSGATIISVPYTVSSTGGATAQTISLNVALNPGTGYRIGQGGTAINLNRNTSGAVYPYTSSAINVTGNNFDPVYWYYIYNWKFSTGCESARTAVVATVDNTPGCTPLPVYLLQFSGTKDGLVNKLQFTTANETNNKGFYIERSADGSKFSSIGYVSTKASNGNSTGNLVYNFIDEKPLAGNNYYRLKQEDKDGKTTLSNVVAIKNKLSSKIDFEGLFPNPASNQLTIQVSTPTNEKINILITDLQGKVVKSQLININTGINNLNLDISSLSSGNYFIKGICNTGCITTTYKFIKH